MRNQINVFGGPKLSATSTHVCVAAHALYVKVAQQTHVLTAIRFMATSLIVFWYDDRSCTAAMTQALREST